jgi:hypothetical protein
MQATSIFGPRLSNKAKKNVTKGVAKTAAKVEKVATKANKKTKKQ